MYDCLLCSDDLAQVGSLKLAPACPRLPFVFQGFVLSCFFQNAHCVQQLYLVSANQLHTILMYILCACCVPRTSMTLWLRLLTFYAPHLLTRLVFVLVL